MQNDDKQRPGQPTIHTHLPDSVPPEDVKKIVGEPVPHGADYNSPPPRGAGKSMGSGLDDSVGGPGLGRDPVERGLAATTRDQDSRADDRHMGNFQQGGGNQQQGNQQQGNQQQGNQQEGSQQQGNQQQGNQQQGSQQQGGQSGGAGQQGSQSAGQGNAQRDTGSRSEGLLPARGETDGRYDVAEEVSLDQQSDQARRVGSMEEAAKGPHGDKLADAVSRTLGKDGGKH